MASFDIDVNKMPLGQVTKHQVGLGYDVLQELEEAITKKKGQANCGEPARAGRCRRG